jgi:hypothetical protein
LTELRGRARSGSAWRLAVACCLLALCLAGCAASDDTSGEADLPPSSLAGLTHLFGSAAARYGFRITRGALQNPSRPSYGTDPHGTHLALYLQPTGPMTAEEYADLVMPTARIFLPSVFRRWPGLKSFDLCLEPTAAIDDSPEPPPVTKIYVERSGFGAVGWRTASLLELRRLQRHDIDLYLSEPVEAELR